ncbi:MAG: hypothetical protein OIF32_05620 [Campylobacterales bacterium]|nr:hypothetical protein [Campylobacterales bacterium]
MRTNLIKKILIIAGVIEISVGFIHFFMMGFIQATQGFGKLASFEFDFVTLVVFCVGILLIAFGFTTLLLAKNIEKIIDILYYYLIIKVSLWTTRVLFEILYPINFNMFLIDPFTTIVLPGLIVEMLLFYVALYLIKKELR